jgi:hypothetical protein
LRREHIARAAAVNAGQDLKNVCEKADKSMTCLPYTPKGDNETVNNATRA